MAVPVNVTLKLDANQAMETIGRWVTAFVARLSAATDTKIKQAVPELATKLARQAGLNTAFAVSLEESPQSFDAGRAQPKLDELQKGMKEIIGLLKTIDPQFGITHTDLIASMTEAISVKDEFLWKTRSGNLFDAAFRASVAEGMRSQAKRLRELAEALSAAAKPN